MEWVSLIRSLFALLVGIAVGFAIFGGLQYYFKPELWISVAVAPLGALYTFVSSEFDTQKWPTVILTFGPPGQPRMTRFRPGQERQSGAIRRDPARARSRRDD
jgi:hypothetical protein